jgi:DNA-binding NarL/FixJ family response regulator
MAAGATNRQIAETLVVSIHTVKTLVAHILAKLHVAQPHAGHRSFERCAAPRHRAL